MSRSTARSIQLLLWLPLILIVTLLPFQPVCREDCAGLCPQCGVRLDENPGHHHDVVDPRWEALKRLAGAAAEMAADSKSNEMEES